MRLADYPLGEYSLSKEFAAFLQEQDLLDLWGGLYQSALDEPNMYGDEIPRHAFVLFLQHLLQYRQEDFLRFFSQVLQQFSRKIKRALPVDELKRDLVCLNYSEQEIDREFSILKSKRKRAQKVEDRVCYENEH